MDIDNRNFIEVMKELSSSTGIELPKDNTENKNYLIRVRLQNHPLLKQIRQSL